MTVKDKPHLIANLRDACAQRGYKPSPMLDALVALSVLGLPVRFGQSPYRQEGEVYEPQSQAWLYGVGPDRTRYDWSPVPPYSWDDNAAWAMLRTLAYPPLSYPLRLHSLAGSWTKQRWFCILAEAEQYRSKYHHGEGSNAPHAICLAALEWAKYRGER